MKQLDYQQAFGAWDRTTAAMQAAIDRWNRLYYGTGDSCQRIAYTVVNKLVRTVFSEYTAENPHPFYSRVLAQLDGCRSRAMQVALVGGSCCMKPNPIGDGFDFTLIPRDHMLVFGRDSAGRLTDVGLTQRVTRGRYHYTLLERRTLEKGVLTIENRLYRSLSDKSLGELCALADHPEFANLPGRYTFPAVMENVGLVELKTPLLNCVDGSHDGVSVYAAAAELIDRIEENERQLRDEFRRGESRIIVSRDLLDEDQQLSQNLFVGLDEDAQQVGLHIFSPQLREQSYLARKAEYLRNVESVIGLQRGMLSDVNAQDRTATEVAASEGEYNLTVMQLQAMWQQAQEETMQLCSTLAKIFGLCGADAPRTCVDWGNGILYDEDKLWADYKEMVAMGLVAPEVALGWRFGMDANDRDAIRAKYMPNEAED